MNQEANERPRDDRNEGRNNYLIRPRINALLGKAVKKPLVLVCAMSGFGKTCAVRDFTNDFDGGTLWVRLSEADNEPSKFWENFVQCISRIEGVTSVDHYIELGFPDTDEKKDQYVKLRERGMASLQHNEYIAVFDDFHCINNPEVARFFEMFIHDIRKKHPIVLICRENPKVKIAALRAREGLSVIQEDDLKFTESELSLYLTRQGLSVTSATLRDMYHDIDGWPLSVNLAASSLRRSPGYSGFAKNAMKEIIFEMMESEVNHKASEQLKYFLAKLSLIKYHSKDLVAELAEGNESLLAELVKLNAYIRFDNQMNSYLILGLFFEYLSTTQGILTSEDRLSTFGMAAKWCEQNNYIMDALEYYEQIGDYETIVSVYSNIPFLLPYDLAQYMINAFRRMPEEKFMSVDYLAVMYLRTLISLDDGPGFDEQAEIFEKMFLELPDKNTSQNQSLVLICFFRGIMRFFLSTADGRFDFNIHLARMSEFISDAPIGQRQWLSGDLGPWANGLNSERAGDFDEYLTAVRQMDAYINNYFCDSVMGMDELVDGEVKFYRGEFNDALPLFLLANDKARRVGQFEVVHRALFYSMRIALAQGKRENAEQLLRELELLLDEKKYQRRYVTYDIAQGWYYYVLHQIDMIPSWLKEDFSPYAHALFPENFGNQMKARFHYMEKDYQPLLKYIDDMGKRESTLYGQIEMLALLACAHYHLKDRTIAIAVLKEAYQKASALGIVTPFLELGKDMRTLTSAAMRDLGCGIPAQWLGSVNKKAALYSKYQSIMIADYEKSMGLNNNWLTLSHREKEILRDLYIGISRADIAVKHALSLSTINMSIQSVYKKLRARNLTDAIRIAIERELL